MHLCIYKHSFLLLSIIITLSNRGSHNAVLKRILSRIFTASLSLLILSPNSFFPFPFPLLFIFLVTHLHVNCNPLSNVRHIMYPYLRILTPHTGAIPIASVSKKITENFFFKVWLLLVKLIVLCCLCVCLCVCVCVCMHLLFDMCTLLYSLHHILPFILSSHSSRLPLLPPCHPPLTILPLTTSLSLPHSFPLLTLLPSYPPSLPRSLLSPASPSLPLPHSPPSHSFPLLTLLPTLTHPPLSLTLTLTLPLSLLFSPPQDPFVAKGACPSCGAENKIFFGSVVGIDVSIVMYYFVIL